FGGPVVVGGAVQVAQSQVEVEPVVGGGGPEPAELVQVDDGVWRPGRGEQGARGFGGAGLARSDGAGDQQGLRGGAFRGGGGGHFGLLGAPVLGGGVSGRFFDAGLHRPASKNRPDAVCSHPAG